MAKKLLVGIALLAALVISGCAQQPGDELSNQPPAESLQPPSSAASSTRDSSAPAGPSSADKPEFVECDYQADGSQPARTVDPPPSSEVPARGTVTQTLVMSEGEIVMTLDREAAPCTVNSFNALAMQGFYNDTSCHRLVDQGIFVLQCGDPTGTGFGGPGYRYADELTGFESYPAGTVAMANAGPDTNGSQFFLVWKDTPLPPDYTVFGQLDADSLAVVQQIAAKGVSKENSPAPISPAKIEEVRAG